MKRLLPLLALTLIAHAAPVRAADDYPVTEDSKAHEGVPKGEVLRFTFEKSAIFPGTTREVWVYVPKQYDGAKPACVYVNQDGVQWNAPTVFDNLIARGEMPVTIGVFVTPGRVKAPNANALDRFNRSLEYDGLGNDYARFLLGELLPEVETMKTADGRAIMLSKSGNDRAIGGSSSGAIAAFTAAWERPDAFSRVFSAIGTYVGLRGGNEYPTLIRKVEPKPLRVFLQDGSNDQNIYGGDWWMANQEMERALAFAGYEVNHVWGEGGHSGNQGTQLFPDAMRWMWKDWPQPVKAGQGSPQLKEILIPGGDWEIIDTHVKVGSHLGVNAIGEIFFDDQPVEKIHREISTVYKKKLDSTINKFASHCCESNPIAIGIGGRLFTEEEGLSVVYNEKGGRAVLGESWFSGTGGGLVARSDGSIYLASANPQTNLIYRASQSKRSDKPLDSNAPPAASLALSSDQTLLYLADARSHWVYSYQIQPDGTLAHKQKYYHLHTPDDAYNAGTGEMCVDRGGRLYVATAMGVQICDQAGRVNCIVPVPGGAAQSVVLGGADFDTLFVAAGGKIYQRKVKTKGAPSFLPPIKPAAPRL